MRRIFGTVRVLGIDIQAVICRAVVGWVVCHRTREHGAEGKPLSGPANAACLPGIKNDDPLTEPDDKAAAVPDDAAAHDL